MGYLRRNPWHRARPSGQRTGLRRITQRGLVALASAGALSLLAATVVGVGPASAAAGGTFAEVQASQYSGFCLDNTGGSSRNGNPIQVYQCLGNPNQGWEYVPSVDGVTGHYQLENSNGMCLDDPGDSAANGTKMQLYTCLGDPSQTWTQVTVGSYTEYENANGRCLDNTGNALTNGNRVQVWACNGDAAQQWYGPSSQSGTIPPPYEVRASQNSGYCLDDTGGSSRNTNPVQIYRCLGNPNQDWKYVPSVSGVAGHYQLENSNGMCLDDPGDSAANGTKMQLYTCLGDPSQTWTQVTVGNYTEYENPNGRCLDNTGNALTNGNRVQVWACNGDAAQQWYTATPSQGQLITVTASYGSTYATLTAYDLTSSGWVKQLGPWTARVGYNGIAAPGTKREGDGKTPSSTYGFGFFFGVLANPGVSFPYRSVYSYDYWDDDPQSPLYNEWVDTRTQNAGRSPEPMDNVPAYNYGAVIAYNGARTPGLGSAIFLHVGTGSSTAGCISLPQSELVTVLTWLNPADNPLILITGE